MTAWGSFKASAKAGEKDPDDEPEKSHEKKDRLESSWCIGECCCTR